MKIIEIKVMLDIQKNVPLAPYTTFRIGGPAKEFVVVNSENELIEALKYAKDNNLQFFMLGGGSNILFSDNGFDGLIIKMSMVNLVVDVERNRIEAGAGISIVNLLKKSIEAEWSGLEWSAGLPGTLGGAIRGNAGTFGFSMWDVIESVRVYNFESEKMEEFSRDDCQFGYRESIFKGSDNLVIISAGLQFQKGNQEMMRKYVEEKIAWRKQTSPGGFSTGSFFKHAISTEQNTKKLKEIPRFSELKLHEKNTIPAGFIIEECGLKGKKIGGAMVSEKHANFIINTGGATAEDVIMLASFVKMRVRDEFGIQLQEEVQYVGF